MPSRDSWPNIRFTALLRHSYAVWTKKTRMSPVIIIYLIPVATVGAAFCVVSIFGCFPVRDPVLLIYLAAIAISFWYGRKGPGLLAFSLSTICLFCHFYTLEKRLAHMVIYDAPIICLYVFFVWWIQSFSESRRNLERALKWNERELDATVKVRTAELTKINEEYKAILDAAPFGIALLGFERVVERCNPAYEKMIGYSPGDLLGQIAPLPEEEREAWLQDEAFLRAGKKIVGEEVLRLRRDGSKFPATLWMNPLRNMRGEYRGLVGFILDNTERNAGQAARRMLTTLVEHSPDLVAVTDEDGLLSFVNLAGRRLLGINIDEDVSTVNLLKRLLCEHHNWDDVHPPFPLIEGKHLDLTVPAENAPTGQRIHLCCACFSIPPLEQGGRLLHAFVAQDVTKRKEMETRLRLSLDENGRLLEQNKLLQEKLQHDNISLHERNLALQSEIAEIQRTKFEKIVGESPKIRQTLNKVEQVASTDVTVLITGETGVGKELIAQAIHENSKRADKPFRAINCGAFPATLMASELFGHEKGAFTGADRQRLGQFELATGGTLFLDEIAELPLETQAMLLRVLEERNFERLGGATPIRSDVRIIVATNRELSSAIQKGEFRQDLYFRLNGFRIEVPPLRERKEDIPLLVQKFVAISSARHEKNIRHIEKRALEMLLAYSWPGNIRELRNVIDTSVIVSSRDTLAVDEELLFRVQGMGDTAVGSLKQKLELYERSLIERALTETHGRVAGASGAAVLLGMPPSTLSTRLQVLKIDPLKFKMHS